MNALSNLLNLPGLRSAGQLKAMTGPLLIIMILGMMILPLPPFVLDLLFTFNIALAIMVLLVSMYTQKPLDFAAFPAVLLFTTLLRLSLNVASTRVVLLEGHTGPDAAGKVVEAFGHFLVGGNFAVGIVVFAILVVINFMVITKGAGRIAEVGARFMLDSMPGKQMSIDADLNAGLIDEAAAKKRRAEVAQESDFYGAMDGASKFVRGDAVAGLLIMFINVAAGMVVGMVQHDLDFGTAVHNYTLLTIGDGLVAQIPALVISTAAGVIVSRVSNEQDVGEQLTGQLFANPRVLYLTAGIIGLMGIIPGMPHFAFLLLAGVLVWMGRYVARRAATQAQTRQREERTPAVAQESTEASWDDVTLVDPLGMEVGYRLITLVDRAQDGELLGRIKSIRKKVAQEIGFLVPVVHIRDNLELKPNAYRITLKGVEIGRGEAMPGQWMAINPGQVSGTLPGAATRDPAFGLPAVWIDAGIKEQAQAFGYTVVDASTVVATHLNHVIHMHAAELLGRQEVQALLDRIAKDSPKLTEDLVPKAISLTGLQKILQNLLDEGVPIRDMRTILDVVAEHAPKISDPNELTAMVRVALGRAITQQLFPNNADLQVIGLDAGLERVLSQALTNGGGIEPGLADALLQQTQGAVTRQEQMGMDPVLLVPSQLRPLMARFLRRTMPQLRVLSHAEVPDNRNIRITAMIGA
ncbi:FlhA: Flagellar biosynthesis protein. FHIPEP (flagella/HR/invasion proteins export pore) family [Cupriavidus taiwanensis]|uniref:Flagellar biosynthesis protein FlhA n=1 Tax=Cupriavidus taiwanensis TaxID=164546 RepID=A0A375EA07_9BURK|nr:flagellar biosynthesis protein FlhA [Cupriavidus taiwanensis]SOZ68429.1 FlhA: Flagellar biosynthesis protein. FHIPEP (flagella/HR/invasion proteins export pore) family [Cupriavidus taiwanensis]SOZ69654.1 FlhA: Flagellar biosynthesis protein. FHIPEP (flagella/HR/invasion proteins export pore) family [Cupriavidus taiwanensis]SOZ72867.1 FlhA: Flagellar biosynthesis protein. FHIPEP (flagella/HR/invasion proteins export pore) family [Cupriavidus taiwanensis]SPA09726.1 FlhA: Flagellar biosynthesis